MAKSSICLFFLLLFTFISIAYAIFPCFFNATMDKAARNHPLAVGKIRRNPRITRKRSPGERPYSVIKCVMHGEKVQGQGNVSLPWLQCTYHDYIEKTGEDSVSYGNKSKKEKKQEVNGGLRHTILTYFCKKYYTLYFLISMDFHSILTYFYKKWCIWELFLLLKNI